MKTSIKFVNHASVLISDGTISILSDPWYEGSAFNHGWKLLYELEQTKIDEILKMTTHIWISHEHPDHFSIPFFRKFANTLIRHNIIILFQKTQDKRVFNFLMTLGLRVQEIEFNKKIYLTKKFIITCIKDGFYDSGLLIESHNERILNLNDCEVTTTNRAKEVLNITGEIDVLLTQFSFAAWKGGENNVKWRKEAANDKIKTMQLQINTFKPKFTIPFASFIIFANKNNFYLNDSINKPGQLKEKLNLYGGELIILKPNDILGGENQCLDEIAAIEFWNQKYQDALKNKPIIYTSVNLENLKDSFEKYFTRIHKNNNILLIKVIRTLSPVRVFKPLTINLYDLNVNLTFDYVQKTFSITSRSAMLSMHSASLDFIFKNSFGFDTLTVNGCFEELMDKGFVTATKTLAIENLNNLGIKIGLKTLLKYSIIKLFFVRLYRVSKKLEN